MFVLACVDFLNVLQVLAVIMDESQVCLNEEEKNHRDNSTTYDKDPGVRNPVKNETPSQNTDV